MDSSNLERLDNATRSKLRSTQILTSLPQITSELVQNSLDAGARHIEIRIHCGEWECWVQDDGTGLNKDGLALIAQGMEGGRYSSSKSYSLASLDDLKTFGFRGEALASAADLSCIEISSRTSKSKESWSIILKGGEKLYYGPSLRWRREKAGTTVSIRDAFFNLPIRRLSHPNCARTTDLVRRELETFALVFPQVTFHLRDLSKENSEGIGRSRVLTIPRTSSTLSTFRHLFGRALVEHVDTIDAQSGSMKIEGLISLIASSSKSYQFLYLNRHILETCDLHRLIDKCFSSSTFAKHALDESEVPRSLHPHTRRSPRKGESRPIYVLNLTVPPRDIDNSLEPDKTAVHFQNQDTVVSFLADTIHSFLIRHGFKAPQSNVCPRDDRSSVRKRRRVNTKEDARLHAACDPRHSYTSTATLRERSVRNDIIIQGPSPENVEEEMTWTDPTTGRTFLVDPRTGNSYIRDQRQEDFDSSGQRPPRVRRTLVDTRWLNSCQGTHRHTYGDGYGMPSWISQALQASDAFASTERIIPCLPSSRPTVEADANPWFTPTTHSNDTLPVLSQSTGSYGVVPDSSLSKEGLAGIKVLGQVDCKFIACLMETTSSDEVSDQHPQEKRNSRTVMLVDQHAADERVRVERFLKSVCLGYLDRDGIGVERRTLDPPVPVLLTKFERDRLMSLPRMMKAFRSWGFDLVSARSASEDNNGSENDEDFGMVQFCSVPEVVADKLLGGSRSDLRELVKGYLARLETESTSEPTEDIQHTHIPGERADEFTWLSALRHCPRELVELVNSRACRGAIMFNDQLSVEQCKRLLRQLSMTAYPFQCAHGRPSIVPLTTIDSRRSMNGSPRAIDWINLA